MATQPNIEVLTKAAQAANAELHGKVYVPAFVNAFNKYASDRGLSQIRTEADLQEADRVLSLMKSATVSTQKAAPVSDFAKVAGVQSAPARASFEDDLIASLTKSASADASVLGKLIDIETARQA